MPEPTARDLVLDDELRALLGAVRRACAPEAAMTVEIDMVADVEQALGTVLPDAILALSIARGLPLSRIVEHTSSIASFASTTHGLKAPFVAIETWGEWPATSVGFARTQQRTEPALQTWDWKTWTLRGDHAIRTVAELVHRRLAGTDATDGEAITLEPLPAPGEFRPRIVARPAAAQRFVVHAKFGRGEVLGEQEGKLRIAFADGERTLLAKFVTDA